MITKNIFITKPSEKCPIYLIYYICIICITIALLYNILIYKIYTQYIPFQLFANNELIQFNFSLLLKIQLNLHKYYRQQYITLLLLFYIQNIIIRFLCTIVLVVLLNNLLLSETIISTFVYYVYWSYTNI